VKERPQDADKLQLEQLRSMAHQLVHFAGEKSAKVELMLEKMIQMGQYLHQFHSELLSHNDGVDEKNANNLQSAEKAQVDEIMQKLSRLHNRLPHHTATAPSGTESDPVLPGSSGKEGEAAAVNLNHYFGEGGEQANNLGPDEAVKELLSEVNQQALLSSGTH
jgi:hypothetical protein